MIKRRETKSGPRWDVRIHRSASGGVEQTKTFTTEAEAKVWMNDTESRIDRSENVSRRAETVLFSEAAASFLAYCKDIKSNDPNYVARLNEQLGKLRIAEIDHERIAELIIDMLETPIPGQERAKLHPYYNGDEERTYSDSTVRKHYFALKKVMEFHSQRHKYVLDHNLFKNQKIPPAWSGQRERRLKDGEEAILVAAVAGGYTLHKEWPLIIGFALETAARAQEIVKADWSDIDIGRAKWTIPEENVKTGKTRRVYFSKKALAIVAQLKELADGEDTRVFHMWSGSPALSKGFRRLAFRAGILDLRWHDLRHEAISRFFEKNLMSDAEIMKTTGHTKLETLAGYMHLRDDHMAAKMG